MQSKTLRILENKNGAILAPISHGLSSSRRVRNTWSSNGVSYLQELWKKKS